MRDLERRWRRWPAILLATLAALSCAGPTSVSPSGPPSASSLATPSPLPTAPTATLAPPPATATLAPTRAPATPTRPPVVAYCAVADVLTPVRAYDAHERTYLDWTYAVDAAYVPPDLVTVSTGTAVQVTPFALPQLTAADLRALPGEAAYVALLVDDPNAAVRGVMLPDLRALRASAQAAAVPLVVLSAYRSYSHQVATFDHWVRVGGYEQALRTSARPGHSEHQLGTALDFGDGRAAPWEYRDWAATPSGAWLRDHAAEFGFVMSYPPGRSGVTCYDYEPWHYRWIGRPAAITLLATGVTLREWQTVTR